MGLVAKEALVAAGTGLSLWITLFAIHTGKLGDALDECATELAAWVENHYALTKDYPSERRRYERDMAPVIKARAALLPPHHPEVQQ